MEQIEAKVINEYLKGFGNNPHEKPKFRLIFTESEEGKERRLGTYNVYIADVFIRTETKLETVPKYSWMKERWVLEQWFPPEKVYCPELPDTVNGGYEPVYVFEDKNFNALPLNISVVQMIMRQIMLPARSRMAIQSALKEEYEKKEAYLDSYTEDAIDTSVLVSQLHFGEAGIVPHGIIIPDSVNLRKKRKR